MDLSKLPHIIEKMIIEYFFIPQLFYVKEHKKKFQRCLDMIIIFVKKDEEIVYSNVNYYYGLDQYDIGSHSLF